MTSRWARRRGPHVRFYDKDFFTVADYPPQPERWSSWAPRIIHQLLGIQRW